MIERNKGVASEAVYSKIRARKEGAKKGRFKVFLPYGAEDFRGLTSYALAGKGKQGEADQKFFEDNLVVPYMRGISAMEKARRALKNDFATIIKSFPGMKKRLEQTNWRYRLHCRSSYACLFMDTARARSSWYI